MARPCSICHNPTRSAIDVAITAGAETMDGIARHFAVSADALARHREKHLPRAAIAEAAIAEAHRGAGLLQSAAELHNKALAILHKAEEANDLRVALQGIREATRTLELTARLAGELDDRPTVNVLVNPHFVTIQAAIIGALAPHPEARAAVLRALEAVE